MLNVLNGVLLEEASRLDGDLYQRSIHTSPWIDLVDTGAFPEGIGDIVSTMIWERTFPTGTIAWQNLMGTTAGNDSITPPTLTLSTAKTLREYRLQHTALESDQMNVNDLRTAAIREEQLTGIRDNLSMNTNYLWRTRARQEYDRLVTHVNLVAAGNVETSGGAVDATQPDTLLSNAATTRYRNRMIRMGAGRRPLDRLDGAPIFGLILDSEVSDAMKSEVAITEALKFSQRANELLTPLGVEKAYKNFFHIIDDLAPRYTFTSSGTITGVTITNAGSGYQATPTVTFPNGGGTGATGYCIMLNGSVSQVVITNGGTGFSAAAVVFTGGSPAVAATGNQTVGGSLTEVLPYTTASANPANGQFGARLVENAAYETAPYTKSYIFHQDVMKLLYPNSLSSGNVKFDPVMYRGQWEWLNVRNLDSTSPAYNPDGTIGRFRGVFAAATKPGVFEYGFAFVHKRPGF